MAAINGTDQADTLAGDAGGDTFAGAAGGDVLTGGAGFDLFVIGGSDSPAAAAIATPGVLDTITDWSVSDRLLFVGAAAATFGSVFQGTAETYEAAFNLAAANFGAREYSAIQVNSDVFVFAIRTGQAVRLPGANLGDVQRFNFSSGTLEGGLTEVGPAGGLARVLGAGTDRYEGGGGNDTITGLAGADTLAGGQGDDQVFGGTDNDSITGGDGSNYLRGDEGDDALVGGAGFDDINGNMGRDTINGGEGTDWVVGGKDDDIVFGEAGNDIVYGNIGNDTLGGGQGDDIVRGGQGDDLLRGDDGRDFLAGDRGADTIEGGLGADTFLTFAEAGLDRVTDFNAGEGDRVQLDPSTQYTLRQEGADTIIEMGFGNSMVLVGVQLSSLPAGWIFYGG